MKVATIQSLELETGVRLDAYFHLSDGHRLAKHATRQSLSYLRLGSQNGINARVWAPARFKRVYAVHREKYLPYLRPSDALNYLPRAADRLSAVRSERIDSYRLREGMILVTCSGRNLGPAVYVDSFMESFVLSHDMVRVEIEDETHRFYVLRILGTQLGQQLLRKDKSGSVIDHITVGHVASLDVPMLTPDFVYDIAERIRRAVRLRESARLKLQRLQSAYERDLPPPSSAKKKPLSWTVSSTHLRNRIDAAPYDPELEEVRRALLKNGGCALREVASVVKPPGRYKTIYVGAKEGVPILSGGQLLQIRPLAPKFIAARALSGIRQYTVMPGWIAYQADGRAEEALVEPVMITANREGWLASGHVGRVIPKDVSTAGSVYLAFQTPHAQMQLKALASGSVVDATFSGDAEAIILPPLCAVKGTEVEVCWNDFSSAEQVEDEAYEMIESELRALWG